MRLATLAWALVIGLVSRLAVAQTPVLAADDDLGRAERRVRVEAPYRVDEREYRRVLALVAKLHTIEEKRGSLPVHDADATAVARDRAMSRRESPSPWVREAAERHSQGAKGLAEEGNGATPADERQRLFREAREKYRLAEAAWASYLEQDELSVDAYESRFWMADARYWQLMLGTVLGEPMRADDYARAIAPLVETRGDDRDDRFREVAARHVVSLARGLLQEQYSAHERDEYLGFPELTAIRKTGAGADLTIDSTPPPPRVRALIAAFDDYVAHVAPKLDPDRNADLFAFQAAKFLFLYGQFGEAEPRLRTIMSGKSWYVYQAFQDLRTIATFEADRTGDASKLRALLENAPKRDDDDWFGGRRDPPCPSRPDDLAARFQRTTPVMTSVFGDAFGCFQKAQGLPDGPERRLAWLWAATLYEEGLRRAPAAAQAPEAAINGALAYKQAGEHARAVEMFRLFISAYGFFTPDEMCALAREAGFREARHVSANELAERYFAGRADGRTFSGEEILVATSRA